jgi:hypothetical protein
MLRMVKLIQCCHEVRDRRWKRVTWSCGTSLLFEKGEGEERKSEECQGRAGGDN